MPPNVRATERSSSPISKMARFEAQPNFIRRRRRPDHQPEIAFSVEGNWRRHGVGSILFRKLIEEARAKDFRFLRITTGAQNDAMRALAHKFGAHLTFRYGESTERSTSRNSRGSKLRSRRSSRRAMPCERSSSSIAPTGGFCCGCTAGNSPHDQTRSAPGPKLKRLSKAGLRCRSSCRCRISAPPGVRPRPSAERLVRRRSRGLTRAPASDVPAFFTSAVTASIGIPISEAAISAARSGRR